tara:strand:- start:1225 stop:1392 length:168 start_codon:yes stop_codon:yes gene_type:complete
VFVGNFASEVTTKQEDQYFKNISSIEQKSPHQDKTEVFLYQKAPHLVIKNHKNSI